MFFKNIIGQEKIKYRLIQSVKDGYIPHAWFIYGSPGAGSLALAFGYARYLHCLNRQKKDSCGKCPSCSNFDKLIHPDLHFVFPIFNRKGKKEVFCDEFLPLWRKFVLATPYGGLTAWLEAIGADDNNAQGLIYARESDEITRKLSLKAYESEYKTMMIWLPEKMHEAASNKLLKILEEPPEKTIFLLISEDPDSVLTTIRSRTQPLFVPPITDEDLHLMLKETYSVPVKDIKWIVRLSKGDCEMTKRFLSFSKEKEEYLGFFRAMMLNAYLERYKGIKSEMEKFASFGRDKQKNFLIYSQHMIRENFLFSLKEQKINYMTQRENEFSVKFHPYINEFNIANLMEELAISEYHIESNVNSRIVFFDLSLKIMELLKNSK